ncbi:MAG TPA: threonine/serine dehydratase [Rhabdochlamydiaceae bacterium]|nr:threonine/serine dehydratase [Rhabdochlamydiaceae bacterium]
MLSLIEQAEKVLQGIIRKTPMEYSDSLSKHLDTPVFLKLEALQLTGSFKIRGAYFRLSQLKEKEKNKGITTCSAGNHGKAVAYAAKEFGIKATIYVPQEVDAAKYQGMVALGADVIRSKYIGFNETEDWAQEIAEKNGTTYISAYDDEEVIAANGGTLAKEILTEHPEAKTFILPVGGGGMAAGFSYYVKETLQSSWVIGCQHEDSPALKLSLEKGKAVTKLPGIRTLAAGIEGGIGERCFEMLKSRIDGVALSSEKEIYEAVRWFLINHQYLIEPSAAVVISALLTRKVKTLKGPTAVVLSGRNVDYHSLKKILDNVLP